MSVTILPLDRLNHLGDKPAVFNDAEWAEMNRDSRRIDPRPVSAIPITIHVMGESIKNVVLGGKSIFKPGDNVQVGALVITFDPERREVVGMQWREEAETINSSVSAGPDGRIV